MHLPILGDGNVVCLGHTFPTRICGELALLDFENPIRWTNLCRFQISCADNYTVKRKETWSISYSKPQAYLSTWDSQVYKIYWYYLFLSQNKTGDCHHILRHPRLQIKPHLFWQQQNTLFLWQPALEGYQEQRHITISHPSPQARPIRQWTLATSTKVLAATLALSVKCGELEEDVPHSKNHIV